MWSVLDFFGVSLLEEGRPPFSFLAEEAQAWGPPGTETCRSRQDPAPAESRGSLQMSSVSEEKKAGRVLDECRIKTKWMLLI